MIVRVNDITDKVRSLAAVEAIDEHPILKALQDEGECLFRSPLTVDVTVVREYDHIRLEADVTVVVALNCSRCLASYETTLKSNFTVFYSKSTGSFVPDEEVELGERELVSAYYEGEEINVSPEIAEHVLIELPLKPLCSEGCRGLCPSCGVDLNTTVCDCSDNRSGFAFSALKNFKVER
ncbi:hypothetical protein OR1_02271 [Geobacter sp. OR-1]|uniref:YceD family protein n=1 Tax=Geobacter sp. OR-1 TaxID=1266765 RepID=UPI0005427FC2|nr:DUF177 domain-containing protein [Geobacter sp. OR-1]GAM09986.1 hypothetical protein OR1_02271 [Geobacter sp. OR-1]